MTRFQLSSVLTLLLLLLAVPAQAQYWMQNGGGATIDEGMDIAIDAAGNTYTTGYFTSTSTFGGTTLMSDGSSDIFITKTDDQGNILWAQRAGGSGSDRGLSIYADAAGNSYITGFFFNTANFGGQSVTSQGLQDVFVAKYDPNGNVVWVTSAGGVAADLGAGISGDSTGHIALTGEFRESASFGATTLTAAGVIFPDAFIARLDDNGNFIWTEQGAGEETIKGVDIACDPSGNIFGIGRFSDTVTFGTVHNNQMLNVIYVIKYDTAGQEQWFRVIGAGAFNVANSIIVGPASDIYITGDFTGSILFLGPPHVGLSNPYGSKIFLAKYNTAGTFQWAVANGSDNAITAQSLTRASNGNLFVGGQFRCTLSEYSDTYGEATFNSVGFTDIFVSCFDSVGNWLYSRQIGGIKNDYCRGLVSSANGDPIMAGGFTDNINIPVTPNFLASSLANWNAYGCPGNSPYCNDPEYGNFYGIDAVGNTDVLIANCIDSTRAPYDYYLRSGASCNLPFVPGCLEAGCPDTVHICPGDTIFALTFTCPDIGPEYSYIWSVFDLFPPENDLIPSVADQYSVTVTSIDGCYHSFTDTIEVLMDSLSVLLSDDVGVNVSSSAPQHIEVCAPNTVTLWVDAVPGATYQWSGPGLGTGATNDTVTVTNSGNYFANVTDSNGCTYGTGVLVSIYPPLPTWDLRLDVADTVTICENEVFEVQIYDTLGNPSMNSICLQNFLAYTLQDSWSISPTASFTANCETYGLFSIPTTGLYTISVTLIRFNVCQADTFQLSKQVYVNLLPAPVVPPFTISIAESNYFCPGDSVLWVATGGSNYQWTGPGLPSGGVYADSLYISQEGFYTIHSIDSMSNGFGCIDVKTSTIVNRPAYEKPQPQLSGSPLKICPNDTALLFASNTGNFSGGTYSWNGPNGPINVDTTIVLATEPGVYYFEFTDGDSCNLVSNTLLLGQFATPQLLAHGPSVLCEGDSLFVSVIADTSSLIAWQPPLSGSNPLQIIHNPGIYACKITSCGEVVTVSVEVFESVVASVITPTGTLCIGDSIDLDGSPGMTTYSWSPDGQTTSSIVINQPGVYQLTTTDSNGCSTVSDPLNIVITQDTTRVTVSGDLIFCDGDSVLLMGNDDMVQYQWFPDGVISQNLVVYEPGLYALATTDTNGCVGISDSIVVVVPSSNAPVDTGELYFCEGDSTIIFADAQGLTGYLWTPGGSTGSSLVVYETGTYLLQTTDTLGCLAFSDTIYVNAEPNLLSQPIVSDTVICIGTSAELRAFSSLGTISWYDQLGGISLATGTDFTTPVLSVPTTYYVLAESAVCLSDSTPIRIDVVDCDVISIPNVFTPNGDGVNDLFLVDFPYPDCFSCKIYNRWGIELYELNQVGAGWDGTTFVSGQAVPDGTYFYYVDYCTFSGKKGTLTGSFTLLRNAVR